MGRRTRRARLLTGAVASQAVSVPAAVDVHQIRATPALLNQTQACLDQHSSGGRWQGETWQGSPSARCGYGQLAPSSARQRLRGQHVVVVGDLAARLWYAALLYLLNGTAGPDEVALGYPQHMTGADARCAWNPERVTRGGYDFGGWGEWSKTNPCHLRVYGEPNLNNEPLTLKKSTGWWGHGKY